MKQDDLNRFAEDLKVHTRLAIELSLDPSPDGLHVLTIGGADFFFNAQSGEYDGWGKRLPNGESKCCRAERSNLHPNSETPVRREEPGDGK